MGRSLGPTRRIVVKLGTAALTRGTGRFDRAHFQALADDLSWAAKGRQLIIVSSGAIALGVERLELGFRPTDIANKQACAAVGQSKLIQAYEEALGPSGRLVAQVLLTHDDVQDRRRYLNARHALERLLGADVIPVINENDTVSVDEIKFGDNDALAALVAGLIGADGLFILSDVDGLYEEDPRKNASAQLLSEVPAVTPAILKLAGQSGTPVGSGGMATKVQAAAKVTELGIPCVITSGQVPGRLRQVLSGEEVGTFFRPVESRRPARAGWIAHALRPKGRLVVDDGARRAVTELHKSLLPSGIVRVDGNFAQGDPIDLADANGNPFARGLSTYSSEELRKIQGKQSSEIESVLGYRYLEEAVHRDDLAVLSNDRDG